MTTTLQQLFDDPPDMEEMMERAREAVATIRPLLTGRNSFEVGYIIAELAAIWLSGNIAFTEDTHDVDPLVTAKLRADLMALVVKTSSLLLAEYDKSPPGTMQ